MRIVFLFHRTSTPATVRQLPRALLVTYVHKNRENPYLWAELYINTPSFREASVGELFIEYQYKKL